MIEISYVMMAGLYIQNKKEGDPAVEQEYLPGDSERMKEIYDLVYEEFCDIVFDIQSKLTKQEFIDHIKKNQKQWLQPHFLRIKVLAKLNE